MWTNPTRRAVLPDSGSQDKTMELQFFCPRWGSEQLAFSEFCAKAKAAGYHGIEMSLPTGMQDKTDLILESLSLHGLSLIGQHHQTSIADRAGHARELQAHLRWLASAKPLFINSQTGRDWFPFEDNLALIGAAQAIAEESGITVLHETHRGKFSFCAAATKPFLDRLPELRLSADFSHWCTVSESLLEDQEAAVSAAIDRTDHIHARVGHAEGPQVSDPRAPEWQSALDAHPALDRHARGIPVGHKLLRDGLPEKPLRLSPGLAMEQENTRNPKYFVLDGCQTRANTCGHGQTRQDRLVPHPTG